jgi:hypothetical protein
MIDDERQMRAIEQRNQPISVVWIEWIGKPDVGDAVAGEHFRLAKLGAADANGAAVDLPPRDDRTLMRFGVRPQADAARVGGRLHPIEIAKCTRAIDNDRGRAQ